MSTVFSRLVNPFSWLQLLAVDVWRIARSQLRKSLKLHWWMNSVNAVVVYLQGDEMDALCQDLSYDIISVFIVVMKYVILMRNNKNFYITVGTYFTY